MSAKNPLIQSAKLLGIVLSLVLTVPIAAAPPEGKGGGKDKGDGDGGTSGRTFALEILNISGAIRDFNDVSDVLVEVEQIVNGDWDYTNYLGMLDPVSGTRTFVEIRLPDGWTNSRFNALTNTRELVGWGTYDPDGDGLDADGDQILDPGDIIRAGIIVTPDANGDGVWELETIFPGPHSGICYQINNDGDIVGVDDAFEGQMLLRQEGTLEAFPIVPVGIGLNDTLSDRDANGDLRAVNSGKYYLPQKYDTATGLVTFLPTFDRATYADAYAFSINSFGEAVGRADTYPAYWSPSGEVSKIPGWPKSKNASGSAYSINEHGEIVITSGSEGPHFYSPTDGLIPMSGALVNPGEIPAGYALSRLFYINENSEIAGTLNSDSGVPIPCVLYPVEAP